MLLRHTPGKIDGHLGVNQAPVLPASDPLFCNIHHGQIQDFQQAVIGGGHGIGLGDLAQMAVEALNGVGGVDEPAHLLRELEIRAQVGPVGPSGPGDFGVFLVPAFPKGSQSGLPVRSGVDRLQIGHEGLQILVGHIFAGITKLVDDAALDFRLRKGGMDSCVKSRQIVCTGNENIPYTPGFQVVEYGRLELGTLVFAYPQPRTSFRPFRLTPMAM